MCVRGSRSNTKLKFFSNQDFKQNYLIFIVPGELFPDRANLLDAAFYFRVCSDNIELLSKRKYHLLFDQFGFSSFVTLKLSTDVLVWLNPVQSNMRSSIQLYIPLKVSEYSLVSWLERFVMQQPSSSSSSWAPQNWIRATKIFSRRKLMNVSVVCLAEVIAIQNINGSLNLDLCSFFIFLPFSHIILM